MHAEKAVIEGNPFIGLFARSSDRLTLVPKNAPHKFVEKCRSVLKTEVRSVSVSASNLVGIFSAMNSNGVVLSSMAYKDEAEEIKGLGFGLNVVVLRGKLTAVGNIILANDKAAVVNPAIGRADAKSIEDCLGVEVIKRRIAGFPTPGCAGVATNKGLLVHGETSDEELHELEEIFGVKGGIGTANMGVPFVGLCVVANSHGYIAGEGTSGFEMARIDEALGFI